MSEKEKEGAQEPIVEEPKVDAFGSAEPVEPAPAPEEKKHDAIPDDHPTIVALKEQIEAVKKEYGTNLSGQRQVIDRLTAKIEAFEKNGSAAPEGEEDVLYKKDEIKWSKDLTPEQREEMTDTEIKQMDEIAGMKTAQNKMYADQKKGGKQEAETKENNLQGWVREEAKALAGDDVDVANQIIEAAKMLNLQGLDEKTVRERMKVAASAVPNYKPAKEQQRKDGKPVEGGGKQDDPFGVDVIVEEVHQSKKSGAYSL